VRKIFFEKFFGGRKKVGKTRLRSLLFPCNGKWGWKREGVAVILVDGGGKCSGESWG